MRKELMNGANPILCLAAGTHGDEFGVIASVERALKKYHALLPDYFWVPEISPSAVKRATRKNTDELDLNRQFFDDTSSKEAIHVMEKLKKYHFDLFISFHEDLELSGFYFYDSEILPPLGWNELCQEIKTLHVPLLTGYDDTTDPILGNYFKDGYCSDISSKSFNDGTLESWVCAKKITKRSFTVEIPGKLPSDQKDAVVDGIFRQIILPLFSSKKETKGIS